MWHVLDFCFLSLILLGIAVHYSLCPHPILLTIVIPQVVSTYDFLTGKVRGLQIPNFVVSSCFFFFLFFLGDLLQDQMLLYFLWLKSVKQMWNLFTLIYCVKTSLLHMQCVVVIEWKLSACKACCKSAKPPVCRTIILATKCSRFSTCVKGLVVKHSH